MNIPNLLTSIRIIFAITAIILLLLNQYSHIALILTLLAFILDFLDGHIARLLSQATVFGAHYDIAADRFIELAYLAFFAKADIIPFWILLAFLFRGIMVDGIRSIAASQGYTAFGESTMLTQRLSRIIVSSPVSRFLYAALKLITFTLLILSLQYPSIYSTALLLIHITIIYCLTRALPVLIESKGLISAAEGKQ